MKMSTYVENENGETFYIDTCFTFDRGLETMVFPCDKKGRVTRWGELDVDRYSDEDKAIKGHEKMVTKWGMPFEL